MENGLLVISLFRIYSLLIFLFYLILSIIDLSEHVPPSVGINIQKLNKIHLYLYCFLV